MLSGVLRAYNIHGKTSQGEVWVHEKSNYGDA